MVNPGEIMVIHGSLYRGYEYPLIRFAVLSETDIFGTGKEETEKEKGL